MAMNNRGYRRYDGMMGGSVDMGFMGICGLLLLIPAVLAIAALTKYLRG
jgi:ABC-type dipeptide/oligopeptide/nickel transport system permease subunit